MELERGENKKNVLKPKQSKYSRRLSKTMAVAIRVVVVCSRQKSKKTSKERKELHNHLQVP